MSGFFVEDFLREFSGVTFSRGNVRGEFLEEEFPGAFVWVKFWE